MSADMILNIARDVQLTDAARALLQREYPTHDEKMHYLVANHQARQDVLRRAMYARAQTLDYLIDEIEDVFHWHEDFDFDEAERYTTDDMHKWMRDTIDLYFEHDREVTGFQIDGVWYMASGGMSWGDPPTEAFDAIGVFAEYKFFDRPFTHREIQAAHIAHRKAAA